MKEKKPLYLDFAATTPVDRRVLEEMIPYFIEDYGNVQSRTHSYGWSAEEAAKIARQHVSSLINAQTEEIVFTSGATEAINWALKGVFESYSSKGNHIITQKTEHKAVLDTCSYLEKKGAQITYLDVNSDGLIDIDHLKSAITDQTILVAIMYGNNETGVLQPVNSIGKICRDCKTLFFCDATQAIGKVEVDVVKENIDLLACSAHKMFGPKGVGCLYIRRCFPRIQVSTLMHGGGHEKGLRSGTLNVPGIVGFGKACWLARNEFIDKYSKTTVEKEEFEKELLSIEGAYINGINVPRLPHITSVGFEGIDGEALIMQIRDKLAVGIGSACSSSTIEPSHVIKAMYGDEARAEETIRISSIRFSKIKELETTINILKQYED